MTDPSPLDDDPLLGRTLLGRYVVLRVLGEGGMGKVYLAEQKMGQASRNVAIKTLHPELGRDAQVVARFHRECATVIELTHPNTVQFYDFGELDDGTLFIVMEYIEGESLARALERGAMTAERVDRLLIQIAGSLHEAHQRGIVHRDLKPENVLLTERGGSADFVKVLDFGIAKRSEAEDEQSGKLTKQGMVLGTPPYMSPEQFSGQTLDARSDIYSLGVMTYEMLVGRLPFQGRTPWEWATKHLTEQPAPIEAFPTGSMLAPRKRVAVMRALEKDREHRQPDVLTYLREFTGIDDPAAAWTMATSSVGAGAAGAPARVPVGTPAPMPASPGIATPAPGSAVHPPRSGTHPATGPAAMGPAAPSPATPGTGGWAEPSGPVTLPGAEAGGLGKWLLLGAVAFTLVVGGAGAGVWWVADQRRQAALADRPPAPVLVDPGPAEPVSPTPPAGDLPNGVRAPDPTPAPGDDPAPPDRPAAPTPDATPPAAEEPAPRGDADRSPGAARSGPSASDRRRADALVERGTRALDGNDVGGAIDALAAAQRLVGRSHRDLRPLQTALGRKASRKVGILLQQGKCPDAQSLYRSLARVGAAGPSGVHFSEWCPRP